VPSRRRLLFAAATATFIALAGFLIFGLRSPTKVSDEPRSPAATTTEVARGDQGDLP
jgi:hypothetical protein